MNIPYSLTACSNQDLMQLAANSESPDGAIFGIDILASSEFAFTVRLSATRLSDRRTSHVEALNPLSQSGLPVRQKYVEAVLDLSFGKQLWDYMSQFS